MSAVFSAPGTDLQSLVYGQRAVADAGTAAAQAHAQVRCIHQG